MLEPVVGEVGRRVGGAIFDAVKHLISQTQDCDDLNRSLEQAIQQHLLFVGNWSARDHFYGISHGRDVDTETVGLTLTETPRRFRRSGTHARLYDETDILVAPSNTLLLGDPGAGKTTTIKRLCRRLLLDEPVDPADTTQFPIVVILRKEDLSAGLVEAILHLIGVPRAFYAADDEPAGPISPGGPETPDERKNREARNKQRHARVLYQALDTMQALVFVDGLDEIAVDTAERISGELSDLALNLADARVVVSCRSGSYVRTIEGFDVLEICPLDRTQADKILSQLVDEVPTFWREIDRTGLADQTDRPLLLLELAVIYRHAGGLPDRPVDVSERMVDLLLRKWDEDRGVQRLSRYSRFSPQAKRRFLAAVSHDLTYRVKSTRFTLTDLRQIYHRLGEQFHLPPDESDQVASEIESHTGLIVNTGSGLEFSHLSLQEYLCADHIVRDTFGQAVRTYLDHYPEPLAIAVALASDPDTFFALIFARHGFAIPWATVSSILGRLAIEMPYFSTSPLVGITLLKLLQSFQTESTNTVRRFIAVTNVNESLERALAQYKCDPPAHDVYDPLITLSTTAGAREMRGVKVPHAIRLKLSTIQTLELPVLYR